MNILENLNVFVDRLIGQGINVVIKQAVKIPAIGPYMISGTWNFEGDREALIAALSDAWCGCPYNRDYDIENLVCRVSAQHTFTFRFNGDHTLEIEPLLPTMDRPVTCGLCGGQMYYHNDERWEPEAFIRYPDDNQEDDYIHLRCIPVAQQLMRMK